MPAWDICYPEDEPALLLIGNESSKRPRADSRVLVLQASASWSRKRLEKPERGVEPGACGNCRASARRLGGCPAVDAPAPMEVFAAGQGQRAGRAPGLENRHFPGGDCRGFVFSGRRDSGRVALGRSAWGAAPAAIGKPGRVLPRPGMRAELFVFGTLNLQTDGDLRAVPNDLERCVPACAVVQRAVEIHHVCVPTCRSPP